MNKFVFDFNKYQTNPGIISGIQNQHQNDPYHLANLSNFIIQPKTDLTTPYIPETQAQDEYDELSEEDCLNTLEEIGISIRNKKFFWVQFPKRVIKELHLMSEFTNATLHQDGKYLIWTETITNNFETDYLIEIQASPKWPFVMPSVFVKKPKIKKKQICHVYKNGSLCLMHPSEYSSKTSILEIRNHSAVWTFCYEVFIHTKEWPAAEYKH